jgi:hypothetical protein
MRPHRHVDWRLLKMHYDIHRLAGMRDVKYPITTMHCRDVQRGAEMGVWSFVRVNMYVQWRYFAMHFTDLYCGIPYGQ